MSTKSSTSVHYEHRLKEDTVINPSDWQLRKHKQTVKKGTPIQKTNILSQPLVYYPESMNNSIDKSQVEIVKITTTTTVATTEEVVVL